MTRVAAVSRRKAFMLVELLVVIAVIALLMAILLPVVDRAKREARAVVCRSNLRQWGLWYSMYVSENDDKFFGQSSHIHNHWYRVMRPYYKDSNDILLCPMATKHRCESHSKSGFFSFMGHTGNKFSSWARNMVNGNLPPRYLYGSYALNHGVRNDPNDPSSYRHWRTILVKSTGNVPVFLDAAKPTTSHPHNPPPCDDWMYGWRRSTSCDINRHDGYVNALFLDWSVRRIGVKELWALKWDPDFNTANEWTKAGGVQREDWPEWMRGFKDY